MNTRFRGSQWKELLSSDSNITTAVTAGIYLPPFGINFVPLILYLFPSL